MERTKVLMYYTGILVFGGRGVSETVDDTMRYIVIQLRARILRLYIILYFIITKTREEKKTSSADAHARAYKLNFALKLFSRVLARGII